MTTNFLCKTIATEQQAIDSDQPFDFCPLKFLHPMYLAKISQFLVKFKALGSLFGRSRRLSLMVD
ncbi:hypothetical protein T01_14820 [Trichinella spiralis]|uniref:Uncharacterized protein n=1 Tax=Trichinella spiralis TaxID=6334 RepID=A0A0V1ATY5_TRISP|nr:hypothetical protein T01_14820 [Trichinella spiralis]